MPLLSHSATPRTFWKRLRYARVFHCLCAQELQSISRKSCAVQIQWLQRYVIDGKLYLLFIAVNKQLIRAHAAQGDLPANRMADVLEIIDPTTVG